MRPQVGGKKKPRILQRIHELMRYETAGDPVTGLKWTQKTTEKLALELTRYRIHISPNTVGRLLKALDYRLRVNYKAIESGNRKPVDPLKRDEQFRYIKSRRIEFGRRGHPVISVDSKKKELIGNFKNAGRSWQREPIRVNDHDFHIDAEGRAIPYGIYDEQQNRGYVVIGTSYETPAFALDRIAAVPTAIGREHGNTGYTESSVSPTNCRSRSAIILREHPNGIWLNIDFSRRSARTGPASR